LGGENVNDGSGGLAEASPTTNTVEPEPLAPLLSVAVAVARYVPVAAYVCCTELTLPEKVSVAPSP
jgi:hypothetical protein